MSSVLDYTLPVRWKETRLENLISQGSNITYGVVQPGPEDERGVPFVRGGDIYNGTIAIDKLRTISKDISNSYSRTLLEGGELLMSLVGYPGEVAIVPSELAGANIARQAAYVKLAKNVDNKYVMYYLLSDIGKFFLFQKSTGSAQQVINLVELKEVNVILPPLAQQKKIAKILSTVDNLIEKTQALIEKYTAIKQGMMADLFTRGIDLSGTPETNPNSGQLRPPYEQAPELYKETELGWVPREWEVTQVIDISTKVTDGDHHTPERSDEGILLLSARNVHDGFLDLSNVDYVPEYEYQRMIKRCYPEAGDILVSCSGTIGRVCEVPNLIFSLVRSVALIKLDTEKVIPRYIEWHLRTATLKQKMYDSAMQAAQPNLFQAPINYLPILKAGLEEQNEIGKRLDSINSLITSYRIENKKHKSIKKGLMQDLLTGKVKVS